MRAVNAAAFLTGQPLTMNTGPAQLRRGTGPGNVSRRRYSATLTVLISV